MKQIITLMAAAILTSTAVKAQPFNPDIAFDVSNTACASDFEMKLYVFDQASGIIIGESQWLALPTSNPTWDYYDVTAWDTDPGPASMSVNWAFYGVSIKNCNTPSTGGSPGSYCSSGNEDGVTVDNPNPQDCLIYSSNCNHCNSGTEMEINFSPGEHSMLALSDY